MSHRLLDNLNPAQREAVESLEGPLLILAGPGSGKTRVITHRIANLLAHGAAAREIVALTFTNKAADEMRARVESLAPGKKVWTSTFHRFCARLLRQYAQFVGLPENYTIYDVSDAEQTLKRVTEQLDVDTTHYTPERIASAISWAKNNVITPEQYEARPGRPLGAIVGRVYAAYQARLLASGAVDFDDLLLHVATLLRDNPEIRRELDERFRYVLVDEYQDTNLAQYSIVRALSIDHPNLAVTGDPDQSIYGWRGASLTNILEFEHDYPAVKVVKLEQNYRSTQRILSCADTLIRHNVRRKNKGLFTANDEGRPVVAITHQDQRAEAESIAARIAAEVRAGRRRPRDYAIFYRMNALSRWLEFALRDHGVPYQMVNGLEFYRRKEIKDCLAYLRMINNPRDDVAFMRVMNAPPRGVGKTTLSRLSDLAAEWGVSMLEAARRSRPPGGKSPFVKRAATALDAVVKLFDGLSLIAAAPVEEILGHVLTESGYRKFLADSESEEDQDRLANIEELLSAARQFDEHNPGEGQLEAFLEETCLVNDTDAWAEEDDRVTLMTLHAAKGLEFPVVFIIACEEGILPHERSRNEAEQLEEERRLLFVGVTRAMEELELSRSEYREFRGLRRMTIPSPFLMEMPRDEMSWVNAPRAVAAMDFDKSQGMDDVHPEETVHTHDDGGEGVAEEEGDDSWNFGAASSEKSSRSDDADDLSTEPRKAMLTGLSSLKTAADLAAIQERISEAQTTDDPPSASAPVTPDVFALGMVVRHPEYGLGKITALGGAGAKRAATVNFASAAGEKKFMLAQSKLRPA